MQFDDDGRLLSHHPSVVTGRKKGYVAGPAIELAAIVHPNPHRSRQVKLQMRRFAALGVNERLDR
jgi:hypothetical protein